MSDWVSQAQSHIRREENAIGKDTDIETEYTNIMHNNDIHFEHLMVMINIEVCNFWLRQENGMQTPDQETTDTKRPERERHGCHM